MKFLCLAYLDRGLAPPPGVAADYGALGEAMRATGVFIDSGQLSPSNASKLVRVTGGRAEVGGAVALDEVRELAVRAGR